MKKVLTLVLTLALCMAIALPAIAEVLEDDHECVPDLANLETSLTTGLWLNDRECRDRYINTTRCIYCNGVLSWYTLGSNIMEHPFGTYYATCNGTTQTRHQRCSNCRTTRITEVNCPGAPHDSRYCDLLPA